MREIKKLAICILTSLMICSGVGLGSWVIYGYNGSYETNKDVPGNEMSEEKSEPTYNFVFNAGEGSFEDGSKTKALDRPYHVNEVLTNAVPSPSSSGKYFKGWFYTDATGKEVRYDFERIPNEGYVSKKTIELTAKYSTTRFFDNNNYVAVTGDKDVKRVNPQGTQFNPKTDDAVKNPGIVYADLGVLNEEIDLNFYDGIKPEKGSPIDGTRHWGFEPHDGSGYDTRFGLGDSSSFEETLSENSRKISYTVKLTNDVVINAGGALNIGGLLTSKGYSSNFHAKVDLNGHTITVNGGQLRAFGLITNSKSTGGIVVNSGALNSNFTVRDFKGGGGTTFFYLNALSPFTQYAMPYIDCKVTIKQQGKLFGKIGFQASSQWNSTYINIIGPDNSFLIQNTGSSNSLDPYITIIPEKFIENKTPDLNYYNGMNEVKDYNVYINAYNANINFNALKMIVTFKITKLGITIPINVNIECSTVIFPVSPFFNFNFFSSTFNLNQRLALMPGVKVVFDENSTLVLNDLGSNGIGGSISVLSKMNRIANKAGVQGTADANDYIGVEGASLKIKGNLVLNNTSNDTVKNLGGNVYLSYQARQVVKDNINSGKLVPHNRYALFANKKTNLGTKQYGPVITHVFTEPIYYNEPNETYAIFNSSSNENNYRFDLNLGAVINKQDAKEKYIFEHTNKTVSVHFNDTIDLAGYVLNANPSANDIKSKITDLDGTFNKCDTKTSTINNAVRYKKQDMAYYCGVHIPIRKPTDTDSPVTQDAGFNIGFDPSNFTYDNNPSIVINLKMNKDNFESIREGNFIMNINLNDKRYEYTFKNGNKTASRTFSELFKPNAPGAGDVTTIEVTNKATGVVTNESVTVHNDSTHFEFHISQLLNNVVSPDDNYQDVDLSLKIKFERQNPARNNNWGAAAYDYPELMNGNNNINNDVQTGAILSSPNITVSTVPFSDPYSKSLKQSSTDDYEGSGDYIRLSITVEGNNWVAKETANIA